MLHVPGLLDVCGWNLLDEAFTTAHAAAPAARLCLNDFGLIEGDDWVSELGMHPVYWPGTHTF